jgi:ElaB/YqjD/DUF883 family membrane-anchored ribosome-binding protein
MDNNVMEKQKYNGGEKQIQDQVLGAAKQFGTKAVSVTGEQLGRIAEQTEKNVRKYPLAAIGIALGSGVLLGTLGTLLFTPKEPTMTEKLRDLELYAQAKKLFSKYF